MVDAIPYELIPNNNSHLISKKQGKLFHYRQDAVQFAQKIIDQNLDSVAQVRQLLQLSAAEKQPQVAELLANQLFSGQVIAKLGPGGSGLRSTRPPSAKAKPKQPEEADAVTDSTLLSRAMRNYLKNGVDVAPHPAQGELSQSVAVQRGTDTGIAKSKPVAKDYEVIVEIAGRHLPAKQSIVLSCEGERAQKKYSSNDHNTSHRSLCRFSNLQNKPVDLVLAIPMKGRSQPMALPLATAVNPSARGTHKSPWDNLLIPVKPLQFLSEAQQKDQADILRQGWLYVFWQGKLWRELAINKHSALSDVDLNFYRSSRENERLAEGHWLDAVWVPYLIKGEVQNDLLLAASPVQWSWSTIEQLEADPSALEDKSATLNAFAHYTSSQFFDDNAATSGAIVSATAASNAGKKELQRQQRQKISTAYLPKTSARLKVQLTDQKGKPWSNAEVTITLKGSQTLLKADVDGYINLHVPADCDTSDMDIAVSPAIPNHVFNAKLNQLHPVETVAGLQARLNNLGFNAGPVDGIMGRKTKAATKKFQSFHQLMIDGVSGPQTQQKLTQIHKS